ncbi:MAG: alanine racemase [Parvibaculaceae bacterium]|nr:alanine racemase [Parvibaculaceae bacterium]
MAAAGGILTVDLGAVAANYALIRREAAGAEVSAVVKADAYGLGMGPVARRLAAEGCRTFFVADAREGASLRALLPQADIYVLNGLFPGAAALLAQAALRPVLASLAELAEWQAAGAPFPAALHFDTGMNRLGMGEAEAEALAQDPSLTAGVEISMILSHLACSDEAAHPRNGEQLHRFRALLARLQPHFPKAKASLANSGGIFLGPDYHFDMVRPGVSLYGGNPFTGRSHPFRPVVTAQARVLAVREVAPGDSVGYGATWKAARKARIAVLAAGYADGFFRSLSSDTSGGISGGESGGRVYIGGGMAPVAGRVSMDMAMADVSDLPEGAVKRGDMAELIGPHISVDEVGLRAGTLGYEILTALGARYMRRYIEDGKENAAENGGEA